MLWAGGDERDTCPISVWWEEGDTERMVWDNGSDQPIGGGSTWTWTSEPHDGGTKVHSVTEYTIPVPVLGKLAEPLVLRQSEREAEMVMANIKERMEG